MSRFDGLLDTTPLRKLIHKNLDEVVLKDSPIKLKVGTVEVMSGKMVYATPQDDSFLDYVLASSSLPTLMPAVHIKGHRKSAFLDGGLRVVAPIKAAFEDGATEVICVACHTEHIADHPINHRNLFKLLDRVKDINVNQIVNNDIAWAESFVEKENLKGRELTLKVIRPNVPLDLDILEFTSPDIAKLIVQGYTIGLEYLKLDKKKPLFPKRII